MHVQPEAKKVNIRNRPLWAPGAAQMIEAFIAVRGGGASILEFGSGASTIFLLRRGATVTTVEHHEGWAEELQTVARERALTGGLTILRRDRPYHHVPDEFPAGTKFDVLLVDGRERIDCLRRALPLVKPDGLVLIDDSQRERYWPAFELLADRACVTFESAARNTTIWSLAEPRRDPRFVVKRFERADCPVAPARDALIVPADYLGGPIEPDYVSRKPIVGLGPVEAKLQALRLIEREAIYVSPGVYRLQDASVAIDAGHKLLGYGGAAFKARAGKFFPDDVRPPLEGAVALPGLTLDLTVSGAGRYSFFLLDLLPKLDLLAATGHSGDDFDAILINTGASWARAMIERVLGAGPHNILAISSERPSFRMERSIHIEGLRSARFTPRWIHDFVDRTFRDAAEADGPSFGPYVYISRQRADGRRIVNHDDFTDLIGPLGFVEVFAEDHTPEELAARLRDAKVIVSPHGAGLANIIFAPPAATVIELFSSHFTPQYFHLARDRDQDYRAFACVDAEGKNVFDRYTAESKNRAEFNRSDMIVPIRELKAMLAPLCGSRAATPVADRPTRWSLKRMFGRN